MLSPVAAIAHVGEGVFIWTIKCEKDVFSGVQDQHCTRQTLTLWLLKAKQTVSEVVSEVVDKSMEQALFSFQHRNILACISIWALPPSAS